MSRSRARSRPGPGPRPGPGSVRAQGRPSGAGGPGAPGRPAPQIRRPPEALRRLLPQALVVAFLAGGTSAFVASDKAVKLTVDGAPRTLHTFADDVRNCSRTSTWRSARTTSSRPPPAPSSPAVDEVVVRYGRPVQLTLDGQRRQVWTTARTVDGALRQLGVRRRGRLPVRLALLGDRPRGPRARRTHRALGDLHGRRPRTHPAHQRGDRRRGRLERPGIALAGPGHHLRPAGQLPARRADRHRDADQRHQGGTRGGHPVQGREDQGRRRCSRAPRSWTGRAGPARGGSPTPCAPSTASSRSRARSHEEVVRAPRSPSRSGSAPRRCPSSVGGADDLNWSGAGRLRVGRPPGRARSVGHLRGALPVRPGTWHALGGSGRPQQAPAGEQTFRAKKLYVKRGASPWPHCGRRLIGEHH